MGLVKRYMQEMEDEENLNDWLRDHVDFGVEEGDPEWEELKERFLNGEFEEPDDWDDTSYEDELEWLSKEQLAFSTFTKQMDDIKIALAENTSKLILKMKFSYIVTLMESCLGDMLKGLIFSDKRYLINALKNVKELKEIKVTLLDVHQSTDLVNRKTLKTLSGYLYHNVEKIVLIYRGVVGEPLPDDITNQIGEVVKIVSTRHDITHRNGYDTDGVECDLTEEILSKAIVDIEVFVKSMSDYINHAVIKHMWDEDEDEDKGEG